MKTNGFMHLHGRGTYGGTWDQKNARQRPESKGVFRLPSRPTTRFLKPYLRTRLANAKSLGIPKKKIVDCIYGDKSGHLAVGALTVVAREIWDRLEAILMQ